MNWLVQNQSKLRVTPADGLFLWAHRVRLTAFSEAAKKPAMRTGSKVATQSETPTAELVAAATQQADSDKHATTMCSVGQSRQQRQPKGR